MKLQIFLKVLRIFLILSFFLVVPVVLVIVFCDISESKSFTIGGFILMLIMAYVFRKVVYKGFFEGLTGQITLHKADIAKTTDTAEIARLLKFLKQKKLIKLGLDLIMPTLIVIVVVLITNSIRAGIDAFYYTLLLCCLSFGLGVACLVWDILADKGGIKI
jgi:hypothetical protein